MVGYPKNTSEDLLGEPSSSMPSGDMYSPGYAEPGKTVDLSGASGFSAPQSSASSFVPSSGGGGSSSFSSSSGGGGSSSYNPNGFGSGSRGPTSIEGGNNGGGLSLQGLNPTNIMRQLASRPVSELVQEHGKTLVNVPRYMARAYSAAAKRYLRPWTEFGRIRPGRIIEGMRNASRRGEIQIHLQRNVLANARAFCPNYGFIFLAMLFMFVCTSPMLLCMLGAVGGGWAHASRSDAFRNRPWTLQIGGVQVPLGANAKMAMMSLPTLLFLHFFMGPVLWSAALYSGGVGLAHAALRDRDDDRDGDDGGDSGGIGGGFGAPSLSFRETP
mmetsp:Transcript_90811/g.234501  ORF Transcript_90811/g.234501 Transcript_90811/m.234501 type:complete len:328 (-) Transcript_90811:248-1231(-)